jgi:hypothetical protein
MHELVVHIWLASSSLWVCSQTPHPSYRLLLLLLLLLLMMMMMMMMSILAITLCPSADVHRPAR